MLISKKKIQFGKRWSVRMGVLKPWFGRQTPKSLLGPWPHPTHCPMKSPTQPPPNPWGPSLLGWSFSGYQPLGTCPHRLILAAAHFPPAGRALSWTFLCSVKKPQKAGRVLMVVALAGCCTVALQSGKKEHHPRNNLAIQMQDLLPKCPWKRGYSVIRNARSTGLKGWAEKGDPGSILEIWTLSI